MLWRYVDIKTVLVILNLNNFKNAHSCWKIILKASSNFRPCIIIIKIIKRKLDSNCSPLNIRTCHKFSFNPKWPRNLSLKRLNLEPWLINWVILLFMTFSKLFLFSMVVKAAYFTDMSPQLIHILPSQFVYDLIPVKDTKILCPVRMWYFTGAGWSGSSLK